MPENKNAGSVQLSKRLRANRRYFIFDANENQLLPVDSLTYHLFPHFKTPVSALKRFKPVADEKTLSSRLSTLENLNLKGFFRDRQEIQLPFSREGFKDHVGKSIQTFTLSLTEKCNLRCKYCIFSEKNRGYRDHSNTVMDIATAKKAVDFILKSDADMLNVGFYGGEPLLKFDLIKNIIDYCHQKNKGNRPVRFRVTTNGTLLSREVVDYLIQNNVQLSVSLDGPGEIHDRHRVFLDEKGSFQVVVNNLQYIKSKYPAFFSLVIFIVVISPPYDYKKLEEFFSENQGWFEHNKLILTDLSREGNGFFDEPRQRYFTNERVIEKLRAYRTRIARQMATPGFSPNIFQKRFILSQFGHFGAKFKGESPPVSSLPKYCKPGIAKLYIDAAGKCYTCENIPSSLVLGDIENGLSSDVCYDVFHDYMEVAGKRCLNCWAFSFCHFCLKDFFDFENNQFVDQQKALEKCCKMKQMVKNNFELFLNTVSKNPQTLDLF